MLDASIQRQFKSPFCRNFGDFGSLCWKWTTHRSHYGARSPALKMAPGKLFRQCQYLDDNSKRRLWSYQASEGVGKHASL